MNLEPITPATERFLHDESHMAGHADAIAFPETAEELVRVVKAASKSEAHLTVQGARTGLAGGAVPQGGWIINLSRMNEQPEFIQDGDHTVLRVQAGVTLEQIEAMAATRGLFFPPNPTEQTATVGGIFATGASGMSGLRYGASSRFVHRLQWVTPMGELWDIRRDEYCFNEAGCSLPDGRQLPIVGQSGTDLIDFLAGSEGQLGIATSFDLSLLPILRECWGVVYFFRNRDTALDFAQQLAQWRQGHSELLFAAEYYNQSALALLNASQNTSKQPLPDFPEGALAAIYLELRGDDGATLEQALEAHLAMFAVTGGDDAHTWAENGPGVRRLRDMRHTLVEALTSTPGEDAMSWEADFAAPPEKFGEMLRTYEQGLENHNLRGMIYGHLLQNRMHVTLSPQSPEEKEAARQLLTAWAAQIIKDGGVVAAEYGIGKLKRPWDSVLTDEIRAARQAVKAFFDPSGRMGE